MQKPNSRARRRPTSGHVMIEAAFIFIVFFSLLIGTFDFGQFLFVHQALVERARYAARWGAVNDATADQIRNMVLFYQSTDPGTTGYFNLTPSMVTVTKPPADQICMVSDPTVFPTLYKRLSVQIHDYSYVMISPYSAGTYNGPNITIAAPIELDFTSPETTHC